MFPVVLSFNELEYVFVIESHIKLPQQSQILVFERGPLMVSFLILYVTNNLIQLGVPV